MPPANAAEGDARVLAARKDRRRSSGDDVEGQLENLKAATIMMVDDEPTTIDVLEMFLEGEGYQNFISTTDSRQALPLLVERDPDVLLLDLMMPNIGGVDILREIRNDAALHHIPVIVLTSSTDAETKLRVLELGATDFLGKPVDPSELALRLRNTLAAKAYRDHLAYYDGLTGLPNRRLFISRLGRALERARIESTPCAVVQIGLDRFKQINEALGHGIGDALLKAVAERLDGHMRQTDSLSRTGGDEFSLFVPGLGADERAARIARRVLADMSKPFEVAGKELFLTSSIGVSLFPDDGEDMETLLANAGAAMSHAKHRPQSDFQFYSEAFNAESRDHLELENQLRKALDREQMQLFYQPKVDVRTGRITGAEALMRWNHPERGMVPPLKFIPIAEESGLIGALGTWALREACAQSAAWQAATSQPVRVAVNVSAKQFATADLVLTIQGILHETGLDPRSLVLELTESVIMQDPERAMETMHRIKQMGAKISIDDFGTGYSSFGTLKRFPVDELKIDRSFVKGVPDDADGAAIVTAIIGMAHTLGMTVVAEGVETEEQLAFLEERGCEEYQGFLFSRPVPAAEWDALFEAERRKS